MSNSTQLAQLIDQRDALQAEIAKHALPQIVIFRINMLSMAIDEAARSVSPESPVRAYIRAAAAREGVSMNKISDRVASEIGVSTVTLKKWQASGVPTTGNKRNVAAIEKLERLMTAGT